MIKDRNFFCGKFREVCFFSSFHQPSFFNQRPLGTQKGFHGPPIEVLCGIASNMRADLTILHTNDAHNRFRPPWAEQLRSTKEATANTLLLDAGDAIGAGNLDWRPWGEAALKWMNWAGYDAMALGNREFHIWRRALQAKIGLAQFPVLCANLSSHPALGVKVQRHCLLQLPNGLRVGLFGLLVEMVKPNTHLAGLSHFTFHPPASIAAEVIRHLKPSVDVVICLSHLGLEADRRLAETVKGMDLIVGGHSHTPLERPVQVGSTWIVQAEPYLRSFGRISFSIHRGQVHLLEGGLLPLRQQAKRGKTI